MKNLTVGIFHDEELGKELGKKGTESDIAMFNRKTDECVFTFMHPIKNKLSAKSQIMSNIDFAIISFEEMTPEVGETILMLDSFEISKGIIVTPQYADLSQIKTIINDTTLESFVDLERDIVKIFEILNEIIPKRNTLSKTQVVIDHSFSVKGVGEVMLGVVKKGVVKKHDKLRLLPIDKDIVVRSIQMQDKDFDEAEAGSRVGLAIKGATAEEMNRGYIICDPESVKTGAKIKLSFEKNRFYKGNIRENLFHVTVGMQTVPVKIIDVGEDRVTIESEKPLVYSLEDIFLLMDLNADKLHIVGRGKPIDVS